MLSPKNENLSRKKDLMLFFSWFSKNCEMHHHETHSQDTINLEDCKGFRGTLIY